MTEERRDQLQLSLNLKNLMSGKGLHVPAIFMVDVRLTSADRMMIAALLKFVQEDGNCMPKESELADMLDCTESNISQSKIHLWALEYLSWDNLSEDNRRLYYRFKIPYKTSDWVESLKWEKFFDTAEDFIQYIVSILQGIEPEKNTLDNLTNILYLNIINTSNKIINKRSRKMLKISKVSRKKEDKRKLKNGRREEKCLTDPDSEYFEDNPQNTRLLINTYITWLDRKTKGKNGKYLKIETNSSYYKFFVKLSKRLIEFRGDRTSPNVQELFWDFFRIIGTIHDKLGWTPPHINQLSGDATWMNYANYMVDNYPDGSYWWDTEPKISDVVNS